MMTLARPLACPPPPPPPPSPVESGVPLEYSQLERAPEWPGRAAAAAAAPEPSFLPSFLSPFLGRKLGCPLPTLLADSLARAPRSRSRRRRSRALPGCRSAAEAKCTPRAGTKIIALTLRRRRLNRQQRKSRQVPCPSRGRRHILWWKFGLDLRDDAPARAPRLLRYLHRRRSPFLRRPPFRASVHRRRHHAGSFSAGVSDLAPAAAAAAAAATQRGETP